MTTGAVYAFSRIVLQVICRLDMEINKGFSLIIYVFVWIHPDMRVSVYDCVHP